MIEVYHFSESEIVAFALMLLRVSGCLVVLPIFGTRTVPTPLKILLSLTITFVLFPILVKNFTPANWKEDLILFAIREVFVGLLIGFLGRMLFVSVEIAGQILGICMGFNAAEFINPTFGQMSSVMEQFETVLGTLLFLAINGHHLFLEAIYRSFQLIPIGNVTFNVSAVASLSVLAQDILVVGVKLSGPMIAIMLFLNIALGVVGRAVPQINVFVTSFPVNALVGLIVFMVSIPLMLTLLESDFLVLGERIFSFMKGF